MTKQPYTSPMVTRVVLQPTQAVLSPCSSNATSNATSGTQKCLPPIGQDPVGCKKLGSNPPGTDTAAQS